MTPHVLVPFSDRLLCLRRQEKHFGQTDVVFEPAELVCRIDPNSKPTLFAPRCGNHEPGVELCSVPPCEILTKGINMLSIIKKYRFLFEELVKRDFKKKYTRTLLGMVWSVLSPLLVLTVMYLVFSGFFGRNVPHFTTYMFCGTTIFTYFSDSTGQGMSSLKGNAAIFTRVNVPKYLFLLSKNVQCLINFGLTLVVFFIFCIIDHISFSWKFIFLLYPIVCQVLFNIGVGLILSALYVFFRDIQYLWGVFLRLLMYTSAIFYYIDSFEKNIQNLFLLDPVYLFIRYFRKIVIYGTIPSLAFHLLILADTVIALGLGCVIYKKYNTRFLYYV